MKEKAIIDRCLAEPWCAVAAPLHAKEGRGWPPPPPHTSCTAPIWLVLAGSSKGHVKAAAACSPSALCSTMEQSSSDRRSLPGC